MPSILLCGNKDQNRKTELKRKKIKTQQIPCWSVWLCFENPHLWRGRAQYSPFLLFRIQARSRL